MYTDRQSLQKHQLLSYAIFNYVNDGLEIVEYFNNRQYMYNLDVDDSRKELLLIHVIKFRCCSIWVIVKADCKDNIKSKEHESFKPITFAILWNKVKSMSDQEAESACMLTIIK